MTFQETTLKAVQGRDISDFLDHIAWTDVIKPRLAEAQRLLTQQLVGSILQDSTSVASEAKEKLAGKIFGITYVVKEIETMIREGHQAEASLSEVGYHLAD